MVSIKYASNSKEIGIAHLCRRAFYSSHVCLESKFPQLKAMQETRRAAQGASVNYAEMSLSF